LVLMLPTIENQLEQRAIADRLCGVCAAVLIGEQT
jgi:hypothetical protein